jgi:Raf kinase inhibitor-like YbhB/YbcL family protein
MRQAFALLGIISFLTVLGVFLAFNEKAEAPSQVVTNENMESEQTQFTITSPVFPQGGLIPSKFTCDGENISPEIRIEGVPEGTESLVLVMDDPDIPDSVKQSRGIEKFDHWAVYGIPADTAVIPEGAQIGTGALNGRGEATYTGPCPPDREHRYFFRVYALSGTLNFIKAPTLDELETAAQGMMLGKAELIGRYNRPQNI